MISFAPTVRQLGGMCLVHCQAGISRSTAATVLLFASWLGGGREPEAALAVQRLVPHAVPNPLLIAYGDQCLGCGGALRHAVEAVFSHPLL